MGIAFMKKAKDTFRKSRSKDAERLKEPDLNTARPEDIPTIPARPVHGFTQSVDAQYEMKSLPQEGRAEGRETRPRGIALLSLALSQYSDSSARVAGTVRILLLLIILAVGGFFLMTLREGHAWGDDFGLYILHAKNIAQGINYKQTGYIYNPDFVLIAPQTYPPVFPFLLSPIYKLWGLNLEAMKVGVVGAFLLSLIAIFTAFRRFLPWPYLVALLVIIGFNPTIWQIKDAIISDLPFLSLVYFSIFLIDRAYQPDRLDSPRTLDASLIGLTIYLTYGTRSLGLVLLFCLLAYDLLRNRRPTAFAIKVAVITGALVALQSLFLHSDRAYAGQFSVRLSHTLSHTWEFTSELSGLMAGATEDAFRLPLFAVMSGLAIIGYGARIRRQITHFEIFPVLYSIPILILPQPVEVRYLLPLMPLYLFYAFLGIRAVSQTKERESLAFLAILVVFLAAYSAQYARLDYGPIREGVTKMETQQFFDYIRKETREADVFAFRKPKALALFTGRRASALHQDPDDQALWKYLRQIEATHLVWGPRQLEPDYQEFLRSFITRNQDRLQETYANADFRLYKIKDL